MKFHKKKGTVKNMLITDNIVVGRFCDDPSVGSVVHLDSIMKRLRNNFSIKYTPFKSSSKRITGKRRNKTSSSNNLSSPTSNVHSEPSPTQNHYFTPVLSSYHRRLILEDLLHVQPSMDTVFILLVPTKASYSSFYSVLQDESVNKLWNYKRGTSTYYQFRVAIKRNVRRDDFVSGQLDEPSFNHLVFGHGNEGVTMAFLDNDMKKEVHLQFNHFFCGMVELWGLLPYKRKYFYSMRDRSNVNERNRLFNSYLCELEGDVAGSLLLIRNYESTVKHNEEKQAIKSSHLLQLNAASFKYDLGGVDVRTASNLVGSIISERIKRCFGSFISWSDPILRRQDLDDIGTIVRQYISPLFALVNDLMGFKSKANEIRSEHLSYYYDDMSLFLVMMLCRIRNQHLFVEWAIIASMASYGTTLKGSIFKLTSFFGQTCSYSTLLQRLKEHRKSETFFKRMDKCVDEEGWLEYRHMGQQTQRIHVSVSMFDNSQRGVKHKHQVSGNSSSMVRLTSRCYVKPWFGAWSDAPIPLVTKEEVTFSDQKIPSTIGMPPFELLFQEDGAMNKPLVAKLFDSLNITSFFHKDLLGERFEQAPSVDVSGKRVSSYMETVEIATNLRLLHRHLSLKKTYCFRPDYISVSTNILKIEDILNERRGRSQPMHLSSSYLSKSTEMIKGRRPKAQLICPPVLPDDEVTKEGMAVVIIKTLLRNGLLRPLREGESGHGLKAVDDIKDRHAIIACDGLSHERWRQFESSLFEINKKGFTFTQQYEQAVEVRKALDQVVLSVGDLHLSLFHTLGSVFLLFYGGMLQPIQIGLGIKRIQYTKIEKCYEQASSFLLLVLTRCEARLMDEMIYQMSEIQISEVIDGMNVCSSNVELMLASRFHKWLYNKSENSPDVWFRFICNFVRMGRDYRYLREAIRFGSSIVMESVLPQFLGVWIQVNKFKCLELVVCSMEDMYYAVPFIVLQIYRDNRFARLFDGLRKDGFQTSFRALDEIMEVIQHKYKSMSFRNTIESWIRHSYHMPLVQECITFLQWYYHRPRSVALSNEKEQGRESDSIGSTVDPTDRKTRSMIPRRTKQKIMIDEILTISSICHENPERTDFDKELIWKSLEKMTTVYDNTTDGNSTIINEESRVEEQENIDERRCSEVCSLLQERVNVVSLDVNEDDAEGIEQHDTNIELAPEEVIETTFDESISNYILQDDRDTEESIEVIIAGKTKRFRNTKKVKINELSYSKLYMVGKEKVEKMNLPVTRHRKKKRDKREKEGLFDNLYATETIEKGHVQSILSNFDKLNNLSIPTYVEKARNHNLRC